MYAHVPLGNGPIHVSAHVPLGNGGCAKTNPCMHMSPLGMVGVVIQN